VLKLSADKIIALIDLLNSIPLPQFEDDEPQKFPIESPLTKANIRNRAKMRAIMEVNEIEDEVLADHILTAPGDDDESRSGSPSSETKSVDHTREHQKQLSLRINLAKVFLSISLHDH
jgi:hypothetical protein